MCISFLFFLACHFPGFLSSLFVGLRVCYCPCEWMFSSCEKDGLGKDFKVHIQNFSASIHSGECAHFRMVRYLYMCGVKGNSICWCVCTFVCLSTVCFLSVCLKLR